MEKLEFTDLKPWQTSTIELPDGSTIEARMEPDETHEAPWDWMDGTGVVSAWRRLHDWRGNVSKSPGERVLCTDDRNQEARFYDMQETQKIALRDGWGCGVEGHDHKSKGELAACAVERDFQWLRAWCEDRWAYYGVVLKHIKPDGYENDHVASLWGVEYGDNSDNSYATTTANELLDETGLLDEERECNECFEDAEGTVHECATHAKQEGVY